MHDIHCHILPGVDDGAQTMADSLAMLQAALRAGVSAITCTPHVRDPYFDGIEDYKRDFRAYEAFAQESASWLAKKGLPPVPVTMGFEVNVRKLEELGLDWLPRLCTERSRDLLLELSVGASPSRYDDYERLVFRLQGEGYHIIVAHPERYRAIQQDLGLAEELGNMGCDVQAGADFIEGGRLGREKKPARELFRRGLYTHIASDAHNPHHYDLLARAAKKYGKRLPRHVWD